MALHAATEIDDDQRGAVVRRETTSSSWRATWLDSTPRPWPEAGDGRWCEPPPQIFGERDVESRRRHSERVPVGDRGGGRRGGTPGCS
jgi:hypothetical protein